MVDEPVLEKKGKTASQTVEKSIKESIRELIKESPYGILCTQFEGQPYGSMIAYTMDKDLEHFYFTTPRATRKYSILSKENRVAFVIDNRASCTHNHMKISALTITGIAREIESDSEKSKVTDKLMNLHPFLEDLLGADSAAIYRVKTIRFLFVDRFQEVREWIHLAP